MDSNWTVLGFDVRQISRAGAQVVSVDPSVLMRPNAQQELADAQGEGPWSQFGLLRDPSDLEQFTPEESSHLRYICVGCDRAVWDQVTRRFGSEMFSGTAIKDFLSKRDWDDCGFDSVDLQGLFSGLHGCGKLPENIGQMLNKHQLFDDLEKARWFSEVRGVEIPSHAPFVALKVLMKVPKCVSR